MALKYQEQNHVVVACLTRQMKRDPCKELWCSRVSFSSFNNQYCQTRREPALEGTKCGENKV